MTGFSFIIKNDERSKWEGSKISKPELAKYIQPQFLGVLNFFDTNLKNETGLVTLEEKVDILSSLTEIIKLMGSEFVASVKHKILSTLNSGKFLFFWGQLEFVKKQSFFNYRTILKDYRWTL